MSAGVNLPIGIAATFLWIGFVGAISFMEAWLKFRAPGVDLETGLGIGKLVFSALNKVEIILALAILIQLMVAKEGVWEARNIYFFIPLLIIVIQSLWLLPALDVRADLHISGADVHSSNLHIYYVVVEVIKIIALSIFGLKLLAN